MVHIRGLASGRLGVPFCLQRRHEENDEVGEIWDENALSLDK
jgi:hypothetical protein